MDGEQPQRQEDAKNQFGKLFVGQVPAVCSEEMLAPLFNPYGDLVEIKVMRDGQGRSKGCAWVRYATQAMAQTAIDALHEKHTIPPQTNTLQVRYAHSAGPSGGGGGGNRQQGGGGNRRQRQFNDQQSGQGGNDLPQYASTAQGSMGQNNPYAMNPWQALGNSSFTSTPNGSFAQMQWPQYGGGQQGGGGGGKGTSPPGLSIFVGNLPPVVSEADLSGVLAKLAPEITVSTMRIHRDRRFGFITFATEAEANEAAKKLNGIELHDKQIRAEVTQNAPKPRPPRTDASQQQQQQQAGVAFAYQQPNQGSFTAYHQQAQYAPVQYQVPGQYAPGTYQQQGQPGTY